MAQLVLRLDANLSDANAKARLLSRMPAQRLCQHWKVYSTTVHPKTLNTLAGLRQQGVVQSFEGEDGLPSAASPSARAFYNAMYCLTPLVTKRGTVDARRKIFKSNLKAALSLLGLANLGLDDKMKKYMGISVTVAEVCHDYHCVEKCDADPETKKHAVALLRIFSTFAKRGTASPDKKPEVHVDQVIQRLKRALDAPLCRVIKVYLSSPGARAKARYYVRLAQASSEWKRRLRPRSNTGQVVPTDPAARARAMAHEL